MKKVRVYHVDQWDVENKEYRHGAIRFPFRFQDDTTYLGQCLEIRLQANRYNSEEDQFRSADKNCHAGDVEYTTYYGSTWHDLYLTQTEDACKLTKAIERQIEKLGLRFVECELERILIALKALGYKRIVQHNGKFYAEKT